MKNNLVIKMRRLKSTFVNNEHFQQIGEKTEKWF